MLKSLDAKRIIIEAGTDAYYSSYQLVSESE
jgi:hypothetical protein